jgi:hypothetical protein
MRQYYVCLLKSIETLFFSHVITSLQDDGNDFAAARSSFLQRHLNGIQCNVGIQIGVFIEMNLVFLFLATNR